MRRRVQVPTHKRGHGDRSNEPVRDWEQSIRAPRVTRSVQSASARLLRTIDQVLEVI